MDVWRKSTLKSLLNGCSWQYALEYEHGVEGWSSPQAAVGTGFHAGVETWEASKRTASMEEVMVVASDAALAECKSIPIGIWFEHSLDPEWVMEKARESVALWWDEPARTISGQGPPLRAVQESREPLLFEEKIQVEHPATTRLLSGTLDWVGVVAEGDADIIVDNKTASSFRKWTFRQEPSIEEAMYTYLYRAIQQVDRPILFEWHVVSAKEKMTRLIQGEGTTPHLLAILEQAVMEADVLAKHQAYRPNPTWNLCHRKWCPFYEGCVVTGELSPSRIHPTSESAPHR